MLMTVIVLITLTAVVYGILKNYSPQAVLLLAGMFLLVVSAMTGLEPIIPPDESTGFWGFDLFERLRLIFSAQAANLGMTIMAVGGFAAYMSHIGASQALVKVTVKPVSKIKSPYMVMVLCYLVSVFLSMFITSATGLGLLLMVTMYPVMRSVGLSAASSVGVIATSQAFEIGHVQSNVIFSADKSGMDPTAYFTDHQIFVAIPVVVTAMILHYLWQKWCDRQDGYDPRNHVGDLSEMESGHKHEGPDAPVFYALLPIIPFVLMLVFSKLLISSISMHIVSAMLISMFIGMLFEFFSKFNFKEAIKGFSVFLDGMGSVFGSVVGLIIAAQLFAQGLTASGTINALLDKAMHLGMGASAMALVLTGVIVAASLVMGSGNAAFMGFGSLAPEVAGKFGVPAVHMLVPMQMASSIGRTMSPIAAVIIACAGIAKISPFTVVKRTSVPMIGSLLVLVIIHTLRTMGG